MEDNIEENLGKSQIETAFLEIVVEKKDLPISSDFIVKGITRDQIRRNYGNMSNLYRIMFSEKMDEINKHLTTVTSIFSEEKDATRSVGKSKKFIITTAVASAQADTEFLAAIDNYASKNKAQIIIMPCESKTNSFNNETAVFDPVFSDSKYLFVQRDTAISTNISLCSIQVSANQVKPITGLARIGKRSGSYVFASPKQFLEYYPNGHIKGRNYAIMTPGACTKPAYFTENFVSKRLAYIGENDHTMGAVIVEVEDNNSKFHFRQVQADGDGSFIDLGIQYNADGTTSKVDTHVVLGDIHGTSCDAKAIKTFAYDLMRKNINVKSLFVHDLFDGKSINHHEQTIGSKAKRHNFSEQNLKKEIVETKFVLDKVNEYFKPEHIYVVKSNHDEFLNRYLMEGRYIDDPENHYTALKIAPALFEDKDVLQYAIGELEYPVTFLSRDDSVKVSGVELGAHGDLGMNGAKPSLNSLEIIYGKCVVGHNHSAAIQRGVFRVGTMSMLDLQYNRGPSSWTPTNALVYPNGQIQLLNYMNEKYFL